jgi:hypothetical protein
MLWVSVALACLALQTREERVLELLRTLEARQSRIFWYGDARFERAGTRAGEGPVIVARTSAICGNGLCLPDAEPTRALARELFAIYGLDPAGRAQAAGAGARLDGLDAARRVGFELRFGELRVAEPEARAGDLTLAELAELEAEGHRLHVASLDDYLSTEGDVFTPTLAYLSGVVEFLNASTEGEDVELGGLRFEREATLRWPRGGRIEIEPGVRGSHDELGPHPGAYRLTLDQPGRVRVRFAGAADFRPPEPFVELGRTPEPTRALVGSTLGAPSALAISMVKLLDGIPEERLFPAPVERVRVLQERAGAEPLLFEGRSANLFLPSAFDLAQPFVVELELGRGRYRLNSPLRLGAADR